MGKFAEFLGQIDGFDIINFWSSKLKKEELFEEIKKVDKDILDDCKEVFNNKNGRGFLIVKKKMVHGVYLFDLIEEDKIKVFKLVKHVFTDEVSKEVREKYDNQVIDFVKEYIAFEECKKIYFDNEVIQYNPKKNKWEIFGMQVLGFLVGYLIGYGITSNKWYSLIFGFMYVPLFASGDIVVQKKRNTRKTKKEKVE